MMMGVVHNNISSQLNQTHSVLNSQPFAPVLSRVPYGDAHKGKAHRLVPFAESVGWAASVSPPDPKEALRITPEYLTWLTRS